MIDEAAAKKLSERFAQPETTAKPTSGRINASPEALAEYLQAQNITVAKTKPGKSGSTVLVLDGCPMNGDHGKATDTAVILLADGKIGFECKHNGCLDYKWSDVRRRIDPDHRTGGNGSATRDAWAPPIPLGQFNLPKFPADVMPESLKPLTEYCDAVAESLQVPRDMCYVLALAVGATALAKKIEVLVSADHVEPVNIFGVVVQPPACRKTATIARMFAPVGEFERQENERLAPSLEDNANTRAILVGALKEARSQASKAKNDIDHSQYKKRTKEISEELRNVKPMYPLQLTADDITPEAVASCLHQQRGRLAIVSAEGGIFQQIGGRYSANGMPNLDTILKGHAGDSIRVNRVNKDRPAEFIDAPALTMALTIQPDVLHGLMEQKGFRGRGLLARFLYSLPTPTIGRRNLHPKAIPPSVAAGYRGLLRESLALEPLDGPDGPMPHVITVGAEATVELDAFKAEIESGLADGGEFESMRDWFGKLVGAVCRIAGIFHGLQYAGTGGVADAPIDGPTMKAAIQVGRYFGEHAKAAYFEMGSDPAIEIARRIIASLTTEPAAEVTKRDLWQRLKGGLNRADELDEPLALLVEHEYLRERESQNKRQGRGADHRSQTYLVNPNLPKYEWGVFA